MPRPFAPVRAFICALILLGVLGGPPVPGRAAAHLRLPYHGGTVTEGLAEAPDALLPNSSGRLYAVLVQQTLFAPLFYSDVHGTIQPGLASVVPTPANGGISSDGRSYTFHLRPGLRWSDGAPLTARDLDFSWRLWTNAQLAPAPFSTLGIDRIVATTISLDGLSITFRLVQPYAPFLSDWTDSLQPLPAHLLRHTAPARLGASSYFKRPGVSSGPFTLRAIAQDGTISVVRNPRYYQAAAGYPYLRSIVFRTIPGQAALLGALRARAIDAAWLLPITDLETLRGMPRVKVLPLRDPNWEVALINTRNPILRDVRVRQALEYGLNRAAEIRLGWHGMATLLASDQPPGTPANAPGVAPYPYNPARAAILLDEAGWRKGPDGFRHKGTQILSLSYSTTFNNPWRQLDEAQALSDYERLGIQLVIRNYPPLFFANQVLPSGRFDLAEYVFNTALDPDDTANFGTRFSYPQGTNYGSYSNPRFDQLASQEVATVSPILRTKIFQRMQQLLHDDLPALWLYSPDDLAAASTRLHNYRPAPFSLDTWNAWQWWVDPPVRAVGRSIR